MKAEKCRLLMKNDSFLDYLEAGRDVCVRCFRKMWQRNFVPKIPSMKIKDFMISLALAVEIRVIGIRPVKMHEILVTTQNHGIQRA